MNRTAAMKQIRVQSLDRGRDVRLVRNAIGCGARGFNGKIYYSCPSVCARIGACNAGAASMYFAGK